MTQRPSVPDHHPNQLIDSTNTQNLIITLIILKTILASAIGTDSDSEYDKNINIRSNKNDKK